MTSNLSLGSVSQPEQEKATRHSRSITTRILVGAFLSSAWGASLRTWMALLALEIGDTPRFTWLSTFGGVLFPATLMGALLGAATHVAETSDRKRWRWVILSPLLLIAGPVIFTKDFFTTLVKTGMGSGAIGVALIGLLGGYTLSGFGTRWTRWVAGFLTISLTIASVFPVYFANRESVVSPSTSKVFGMLQFVFLMVLLIAGVSAPSRRACR